MDEVVLSIMGSSYFSSGFLMHYRILINLKKSPVRC